MRTMRVRIIPIDDFDSATSAVAGGISADAHYRTVQDSSVCGKWISALHWSERQVTMSLAADEHLNISAEPRSLICSFDSLPALRETIECPPVVLEFSRVESTWNRHLIAHSILNRTISRLWFSRNMLFVYIDQTIVQFSVIEDMNSNPILYWTGTT